MIHIIPNVKKIEELGGVITKKAVCYAVMDDKRLASALEKLPYDKDGIMVAIDLTGGSSERYELWIREDGIQIVAEQASGAFYAIQTLRQIWEQDEIPCLHIEDNPDYTYRGFYHDVTRGKVPTVATIKALIDRMAYYKLNSLQLYVEHTFEFEECKELNAKTGCLTKAEIEEIGAYCAHNFIEFIPSLSTFGHMYDILQQEKYQHLRVLKDFEVKENVWDSRMRHHTINPLNPESIEVV